jgi:hypothetical protein
VIGRVMTRDWLTIIIRYRKHDRYVNDPTGDWAEDATMGKQSVGMGTAPLPLPVGLVHGSDWAAGENPPSVAVAHWRFYSFPLASWCHDGIRTGVGFRLMPPLIPDR